MALSVWTERSGYSFGTIQERETVSLALPLDPNPGVDYTLSIISGALPGGLRLENTSIVGTPFEVPRPKDFGFVVRAEADNGEIADRYFKIRVEGTDEPQWLTPAGSLPVGTNSQYFVLDNSFVDFQLSAIDQDLATGENIEYFIQEDISELPPGLVLLPNGRIVGFVQPLLSLNDDQSKSGAYDTNLFDAFAFDYGLKSTNGYDSYVYDELYDFFVPTRSPRKLNRNFEFTIGVTDNESVSYRTFRIYVVGDDFLRADNGIMTAASGLFTADGTFLRKPIWVTPSYLGLRRANNYITIFLDVYDTVEVLGGIIYDIVPTNDDGSPSVLPPGLTLERNIGELFGYVPYQPAITKTYKFTISATRIVGPTASERISARRTFTIDVIGEIDSTISWLVPPELGVISANFISTFKVEAETTVPNAVIVYRLVSGRLPPGLTLSLSGEIIGKVNQFAYDSVLGLTTFDGGDFTLDNGETSIDRRFKFTVRAQDQYLFSAVDREFYIDVIAPDDRLYSNVYVQPFLKQSIRDIWKEFISNTDIFDFSKIYRLGDPNFGIQKNLKMLAYAGIERKSANVYASIVGLNHKRKQFKLGALKVAVAKNRGSNEVLYEVIYIDVIDPLENANGSIAEKIRTTNLKQPLTVDVQRPNSDGGPNVSSPLGGPETVFLTESGDELFEESTTENGRFLYRRLGDPEIPYSLRPAFDAVSVDTDGITLDQTTDLGTIYPSSLANMRARIDRVGVTERDFLPLWMRTAQPGSQTEVGFVKAIPICYVKPGTSQDILLNIKNSGFNFQQINYVIDRYIFDSVEGSYTDKYIAFPNNRMTVQ
jgi:hypothetical protein